MAKYRDANGNVIEVGSPELNPGLVAGKTQVPDSTPLGAISSSTLTSSPSYDFRSPQLTPTYPVASLNADASLAPTTQENKASTLTDQLQSLNNQLLGQSDYRAQQEQAVGLPSLLKTQNDLSARLNALKNEALAIPLQLQQDSIGRGITAGGLQPIQTAALRNNAIQALSTSSLLEASRGNISLAQDLAEKAVAQRFDPIKEQIAAAQANLDLVLKDPRTSIEDRNRAAAQKAIQDQRAYELQQARTTEEQKSKTILEYAGLADSATLRAMQNAPDSAAVLQIAAQKGLITAEQQKQQLDQQKTQAEIQRIYADINLTNAQKAKVLSEATPVADTKKVLQQNEALTIAQELLKDNAVGKSSAVGASFAKLVPFAQQVGLQGDRTAFEAKVNTLKANLTLDNLKLLKGAMSDKDLLFLNSVGSSLDVNMSVPQFNKELQRIITKLKDAGATAIDETTPTVAPEGYYQASDGLYYPK